MTKQQIKETLEAILGADTVGQLTSDQMSELIDYSPAQMISKAIKMINKNNQDKLDAERKALKEANQKAQQELQDALKATRLANEADNKAKQKKAEQEAADRRAAVRTKSLKTINDVNADYLSVLRFESVGGLDNIGQHTVVDALGELELLGTFTGKYTDKYITVRIPQATKSMADPVEFFNGLQDLDDTLFKAVMSIQETYKTDKGYEIKPLTTVMQSLYKFDALTTVNNQEFIDIYNNFFKTLDESTLFDMVDLDRVVRMAIQSTSKYLKALGIMGDNPVFFATDDDVLAISVHAVGKFFSVLRKEYMGAFRNVAYMLKSMDATTVYDPTEKDGKKND